MKLVDRLKGAPHSKPHFFMKKKYSTGIYKGGYKGKWSMLTKKQQTEALKKQWYLRWSYRNPETGKMERQPNIYGGANEYHTYRERIEFLKTLEDNLIELLKTGYSPFESSNKDTSSIPSVFNAIEQAMEIKKLHMNKDSYVRFKSDIGKFEAYLKLNGYDRRFITSVTKKTVTSYLNEVLKSVSNRSRNNYRTSIGTLWQCMEDEGVIDKNFVKTIPMLKSKSQRNKTYSDQQTEELFAYMHNNCPNMLLFIKFVSYNFLRPIEVCRLTVGNFDLKSKTLNVMVKQGHMKTKIIPDLLLNELPGLSGQDPSVHIFGKDDLLQHWSISDNAKRGHFSREFKKIKDQFGLGDEYTMYGFRHTFITKLYRYYKSEGFSVTQIHDKLMPITGHDSLSGLKNYLRSIDADLPEDYSKGLG